MRGDEGHAAAAEHALGEIDGVRAVRVYPRTGAVLLWHDTSVRVAWLLETLDAAAHGPPSSHPVRVPPPDSDGEVARLVLGGAVLGLLAVRRSPDAAAAVASRLGITEWRAEALPETKVEVVQALQAEGHLVAVVGDGTNDAPALALADIGIGLSGTDVAVETADVALASNDLPQVADVVRLGRQTLHVVRQSYGLAIGVNTIGLLVGAAGTLNPVLAAVLHKASSAAVVLNSGRLTQFDKIGRAHV